jgi:succinate-acetate transporter protein
MGWRGSGGLGAATIGTFYWTGGFLMAVGGVLEFFLGNTFSCVVFLSFSGFWFVYATTLTPSYSAIAAYKDPLQFYNSFAFFLVFMGLLCVIYLICALRTNIVFLVIFLTLIIAFGLLAGAFWQLGQGDQHVPVFPSSAPPSH